MILRLADFEHERCTVEKYVLNSGEDDVSFCRYQRMWWCKCKYIQAFHQCPVLRFQRALTRGATSMRPTFTTCQKVIYVYLCFCIYNLSESACVLLWISSAEFSKFLSISSTKTKKVRYIIIDGASSCFLLWSRPTRRDGGYWQHCKNYKVEWTLFIDGHNAKLIIFWWWSKSRWRS